MRPDEVGIIYESDVCYVYSTDERANPVTKKPFNLKVKHWRIILSVWEHWISLTDCINKNDRVGLFGICTLKG